MNTIRTTCRKGQTLLNGQERILDFEQAELFSSCLLSEILRIKIVHKTIYQMFHMVLKHYEVRT
jgi:hypothetical protein